MSEPNKFDSDGNILQTILKIAQKHPPSKEMSPGTIEAFYRILEKHQYRVDRTRPRELIYRLLEDMFRSD